MQSTPNETQKYLLAWTSLANLYSQRRFDDALNVALGMQVEFPTRRATALHHQACLLCLAGRSQEAVEKMREVADLNLWWAPRSLADPDLEALHDHADFETLCDLMTTRYANEVGEAHAREADVITLRPKSAEARAAIVALHMRGVTAQATAEAWRSSAEEGLLVAIVESTVRDGDGLPCWDDDDLAARDVAHAASLLVTSDVGAPLLLAGGSQGAGHAIRLAVNGSVPGVRGFIAVVGATHLEYIAQGLADAASRGLRGYMIAGEDDSLVRDAQERLTEEIRAAGVECALHRVDGLGHMYPENFGELATDAVAFLLQ